MRYNLGHRILLFRITSDLIPFASHPVCNFNWQDHFRISLERVAALLKKHGMRVTMHPDQFVLLNSPKKDVHERSVKELLYHTDLLDIMGLDATAKIQIHVGGVYGNKPESIMRFLRRYQELQAPIQRRLVIENDDRRYTLSDCLFIHAETGIPVVFDAFHHQMHSSGESVREACEQAAKTWKDTDGTPIVDYSSQAPEAPVGKHTETIDQDHFREFLQATRPTDIDIMLEVKDKEKSALQAVEIALRDKRCTPPTE